MTQTKWGVLGNPGSLSSCQRRAESKATLMLVRSMPHAIERPPQPLLGITAWGSNNIPSVGPSLVPRPVPTVR